MGGYAFSESTGGGGSQATGFLTRVATTANVAALAGGAPDPVDGVNLAVGDRILVKNQAAGAENGIYVVTVVGGGANGTWIRATDYDQDAEVKSGQLISVSEGAAAADTLWMLATNDPITVGVTALTFVMIAGTGITGAGVAGEITYFTGVNTVSSDPNNKWDNVNKRHGVALGIGTPNSSVHNGGSWSTSKIVTSAVGYTILESDYYIGIVFAPPIALTVNVPNGSATPGFGVGKRFIVKDQVGGAAAGNITLQFAAGDLCDGANTQVINQNYGSIEFMCVGVGGGNGQWAII